MSNGSEPLALLRAADARLDDLGAEFDPMEHADRFEELHDALVAVLADIEPSDRA